MKKTILSTVALLAAALSCQAQTERLIALTSGNRLLTFINSTPGTITNTVTVTGLVAGDNLIAIDFRPATGVLYGLGSMSRLYSISSGTGVATPIGSEGAFTLNGTSFGFDFNPVVDLIRVVSNTDQNVRLNPDTGAIANTDPNVQYAATDPNAGANPNVVGSAYNNSFSGAGATTLYNIDSGLDILIVQQPANNGTLHTVGQIIDTDFEGVVIEGFDISGTTGIAYFTDFAGPSTNNLYSINLFTGSPTLIGEMGDPNTLGTETVVDIAAPVPPSSKLLNISTRGRVGQGEDVLIGGFITRGGDSSRYLIRALGPSLSGLGVGEPLADPFLTLYDQDGFVMISNDDWGTSAENAEITATSLAPTNDAEPAILATLVPGQYTAIVTGKGTNGGVAVVEIYQLP